MPRTHSMIRDAVDVIDVVQEEVIEDLWRQGRSASWPECPEHGGHPLDSVIDDGNLLWRCPNDPSVVIPLGGLGQDGRCTSANRGTGVVHTRQSVAVEAVAGGRWGQPLAEVDASLAERLAARLVDRFLIGAGLSQSHRAEALAQTEIFVRADGDGSATMDFALPLGSGNPSGYSWDGSATRADEIADDAADRGIEDVLWDQKNVGLTGWEPQFDRR